MYEHNALGYWSGLALCLTKVRSSRARCPATALISYAPGFSKLFVGQLTESVEASFFFIHHGGYHDIVVYPW